MTTDLFVGADWPPQIERAVVLLATHASNSDHGAGFRHGSARRALTEAVATADDYPRTASGFFPHLAKEKETYATLLAAALREPLDRILRRGPLPVRVVLEDGTSKVLLVHRDAMGGPPTDYVPRECDGMFELDAALADELEGTRGEAGKDQATRVRGAAARRWAKRATNEPGLWKLWLSDESTLLEEPKKGEDGLLIEAFRVPAIQYLALALWCDVVAPRIEKERKKALVSTRMPTQIARTMAQARSAGGRVVSVVGGTGILVQPPSGIALALPFGEGVRVKNKKGSVGLVGLRQVLTPLALRTYLASLVLYQDTGMRDDGTFETESDAAILDITGATKHERIKNGRSYFNFATKDLRSVKEHFALFAQTRVLAVGDLEMTGGDPLLDEVRDRRNGKRVCYVHARLVAGALKNDYIQIPRAVCKLAPGEVPYGMGIALIVRRLMLGHLKKKKALEAPLLDWLDAAGVDFIEGARKEGRRFFDEQIAKLVRVAEEGKFGIMSASGTGKSATLKLAVIDNLREGYAPLVVSSDKHAKATITALVQTKRRPKR